MATDVLMPQMGESIAEGTIVKWLKKVGETVQRDEPLLEISTDKVDAEIPSPSAGTLTEILAKEGETVHVNSVIAPSGRGWCGRSRLPRLHQLGPHHLQRHQRHQSLPHAARSASCGPSCGPS
jgi:2-oxoglutarate dehydrogenase E2 component (dihydrolipoamide succinyltransferase)